MANTLSGAAFLDLGLGDASDGATLSRQVADDEEERKKKLLKAGGAASLLNAQGGGASAMSPAVMSLLGGFRGY